MTMEKIKIIIADDMKSMHQDLKETLKNMKIEFDIIQEFYNTVDLLDFFMFPNEDDDLADILLLDHDFKGNGANGLDIVPSIRE